MTTIAENTVAPAGAWRTLREAPTAVKANAFGVFPGLELANALGVFPWAGISQRLRRFPLGWN